ncbi:hypothetical protein CP965_10980 [Halarcobacter mediterraneus]|uniref:DUF4214 domain-containing protein n=1 Tax=Halarcobacter mediterraneus TaxID=2023153 RepID=A0A4Q1AXM9_9BACT|nr:methyltransferase domain-containing protein [Halarcobacter mediterraneus]RXK12281.1 hypothetical protein CP965_10980 [Halarcobacter mediterraneus]
MLNSENKNSSVDQIIQKVKEEAKNRAPLNTNIEFEEYKETPTFSTLEEKESNLYKVAKTIGKFLKKFGLGSFVNFIKLNLNLKKYTYVYNLEDLTKFNDEEFIDNTYNITLNRQADDEGRAYYLEKLRNGSLSKSQIIAFLHFSKEGKEQNINISGVKTQYILSKIYKIPFLGSFVKVIYYVVTLPKLVNKLNHTENYMNREFIKNKEQYSQLEDILETKVDEVVFQNLEKNFYKENESLNKIIKEKIDKKEFEFYLESVNYGTKQIELSKQNLETLVEEAKNRLPSEVFNKEEVISIVNEQNHNFDSLYVSFENQFRGENKDIKNKLKVYLPYISNFSLDINILDVGCGRGEWLELLSENGYKNIKGIDLNQLMISFCKDSNYNVECIDVITYLKSLNDETLSIVTGFHIIEHLPFEVLMTLFSETLRVLKKGGMIIFETPNPRNILVGSSDFYLDPTHIKPIHPATLKFLAKQTGFNNVKSLILDNEKLSDFDELPFNDLNDYINIGRDLVVIGYKA